MGINNWITKYLTYFMFLKKTWIWSGGWAHGKKVFWGQVGKNITKWKILSINYYTSFCYNVEAIIQSIILPFSLHNSLSVMFFPWLGLLTTQISYENAWVTDWVNYPTWFATNLKNGSNFFLQQLEIGSLIFLLQIEIYRKSIFIWSGGCFGKILKKISNMLYIQLPSSLIYIIPQLCVTTLGISQKKEIFKLKWAGDSRYFGWIPKVWGIAMNPVDHPHGGRTTGGFHPTDPSGRFVKGMWTRSKMCWTNFWIFKFRVWKKDLKKK